MRRFLLLATLAGALLAAAPAMAAGETVAVHKSRFGQILFDGRGFVLYVFTKDPRGKSVCSGGCAKAWPPYIVKGQLRVGVGAKRSLLGTTKRADGRLQATYAGRPLYYYVGDTQPGQILCQNISEFGGLWLVVRGSGAPVR